ncbi:MAG: hypothetical protein ABS904_00850 [Solibacillus isronensis]
MKKTQVFNDGTHVVSLAIGDTVLVSDQGMKCNTCGEVSYYPDDEMVFFNGEEQVIVTEQYPDWNRVICHECYEKEQQDKDKA